MAGSSNKRLRRLREWSERLGEQALELDRSTDPVLLAASTIVMGAALTIRRKIKLLEQEPSPAGADEAKVSQSPR